MIRHQLFPCRVIFHVFVVLLAFFKTNSFFPKKILSGQLAIRVSNGMDPDQDRRSVDPELGPNQLQSYKQMTKISKFTVGMERVNIRYTISCNM